MVLIPVRLSKTQIVDEIVSQVTNHKLILVAFELGGFCKINTLKQLHYIIIFEMQNSFAKKKELQYKLVQCFNLKQRRPNII